MLKMFKNAKIFENSGKILQTWKYFGKGQVCIEWTARKGPGSHHVNWNSIIYRKGVILKTEIKRPFLAVKF